MAKKTQHTKPLLIIWAIKKEVQAAHHDWSILADFNNDEDREKMFETLGKDGNLIFEKTALERFKNYKPVNQNNHDQTHISN